MDSARLHCGFERLQIAGGTQGAKMIHQWLDWDTELSEESENLTKRVIQLLFSAELYHVIDKEVEVRQQEFCETEALRNAAVRRSGEGSIFREPGFRRNR